MEIIRGEKREVRLEGQTRLGEIGRILTWGFVPLVYITPHKRDLRIKLREHGPAYYKQASFGGKE
jgi:hypothetical protein